MSRVLAIAVAVTLAVPAAGSVACADEAIDLVGPASCCCPTPSEKPSTAKVDTACCCELRPVVHSVERDETPAVLTADVSVPQPAVATAVDPYPPQPPAEVIEGLALARGPPACASLLSHCTALLL